MAAYLDAIAVGAGFCGLRAMQTLRAVGLSVTVLKASGGVGRVRYYDQYPARFLHHCRDVRPVFGLMHHNAVANPCACHRKSNQPTEEARKSARILAE